MRALLLTMVFLLLCNLLHAQEWKHKKHYRNEKGSDTLASGCWLRKDRKKKTDTWCAANEYNMEADSGYKCYRTFAQKRDFYKWFDGYRRNAGHEVKWAGVAYLITKRLIVVDNRFVRSVVIADKEFIKFVQQSNALILKNIYPNMQQLYEKDKPLKGKDAKHWDSVTIYKEQCKVVDTLYARQPARVLRKFNRMAAGKGVYALFVPKKMRMKGDIKSCKVRCDYGLHTMSAYYEDKYGN